jgi:hypothetical protein
MSTKTNWMQRIAVVFVAVGLAGCQENGKPDGKVQTDKKATTTHNETPGTMASATPSTAATAPPSHPQIQPVSHNSTPTAQAEAPPPEDFESDAQKRAAAENMIYATIRIKMEDMIDQRSKLLKSGKDPADVEVRQLEGSIMRARELLEENGEVVEPVDPPIVQSTPNP